MKIKLMHPRGVGIVFKRSAIFLLALFFLISGCLMHFPSNLALADNSGEQTSSFDNTSQFLTGTFDNTETTSSGVFLCTGLVSCDHYVRPVTINNTSGAALISFFVQMNLNTAALISAGKMKSDCSDIAITDSDQSTPLTDGSISNCNTSSTTITVLLPSIAADSTKTIYLYYGTTGSSPTPLRGGSRFGLGNDYMTNSAYGGFLTGFASWDSTNQQVNLTTANYGENGSLSYLDNPGSSYVESMQFYSGGGTGADSVYYYTGSNTTPIAENSVTTGYTFIYDEYHHYIGVQYQGQALAIAFCPGDQDTGSTGLGSSSDPIISTNEAACNMDNSTWHNAQIVVSSNEITMYLDGNLLVDYTSASQLPVATGPLMGWAARTGGAYNQHSVRDISLDVNTATTLGTSTTTVGSESSYTPGSLMATGSWTSPVIDVGAGAVLGNGDPSSTFLSGKVTNDFDDDLYIGFKIGSTAAEAEAATPQYLDSYYFELGSNFSINYNDLGYLNITNPSDTYVQLVASYLAPGEQEFPLPILNSLNFSYTPSYYTIPSAPTDLTASGDYGTGVTLNWGAATGNSLNPDDVTGYNIYYKAADSGNWQSYDDVSGTSFSFSPYSLFLPSTTYDFKVIASGQLGNSSDSNTVTLTTSAPPTVYISDCNQLQAIDTGDPYATYKLTKDIDCSDTINWNDGAGFTPIGTDNPVQSFEGTFDGQGHTIENLYIYQPDGSNVGLFSQTDDATITNVNFSSPNITGDSQEGVLAGDDMGGSVSYVSSNGLVNITNDGGYGGGLIGYSGQGDAGDSALIANSSFDGTVDGSTSGNTAGGLIGYSWSTNLNNDYANANVTSNNTAGGLIGYADFETSIADSYATGTVSVNGGSGGGLVGADYSISIRDSFAASSLTSMNDSGATLGGLSGNDSQSSGLWTGNYYDQNLSGQTSCIGETDSDNDCIAVDTSNNPTSNYFINNSSNPPLNGWDFDNTWAVQKDGYPLLIPVGGNKQIPSGITTQNWLNNIKSKFQSNTTNTFSNSSTSNSTSTIASGIVDLDPLTNFNNGTGQLETGNIGQEYTFTAYDDHGNTSTHTLTITSIDNSSSNPSVTLTLHSSPITITLTQGQTVKEDVNGDGQPDIGITASNITANSAELTLWDIAAKSTSTITATTMAKSSTANKNNSHAWRYVLVVVLILFGFILIWRRKRKSTR